ncbi:prostaglandin E receptor 4 (subtype EP4) a [Takifugu flavidus]|uniref:Prostaglandin E2 receptor EP4 subtype n=1 Tax=Takifugu flavidus TaxID=433684 RepID=A0A5C6N004_9TELE|nr:prostaglandin E receptor 4 (subtype EP4) a [Takifugu flavidus]XP_056888136.1 prostaglandin E receptor 4 (subtype EP4) a [Takifugu flavidus]XP_056888137.1 prostaglandin E receptor 4 (subtype EP4) a [Takifugu flavidus]TWW60616.1 Prostaglandin E2 receptor EP4 subtype [Takifugu flavidus]
MNNQSMTGRTMVPTIPSVMFIFGVIGNVIAIAVLCKSRKEQKETTFYTLVCGLAVTDLLGTLLASPVTIATYVKGSWPGEDPLCQHFGFTLLFFSLAGLSIICAMSVERYMAINHAYFYNDYVDQKLAGLTLLAIYVSNAFFCALPIIGFGQVKKQYPQTWCFLEWRSNKTSDAAYSYMYAGFSSILILATVICNVLVCVALIRMHRRFVRRMSLGNDLGRTVDPRRRGRSFGRLAGAEIQMVILLIGTSAVVLVCSIPLVAQVFLNQLYKTPVEPVLEKNPDLRAIRFASFNPILDPWIYILLRKAVLLKLIEKIKCLFCKMGSRGQQTPGNFHCIDAQQLSSVISKRESLSLVSHNLRDINSSSQTFLYLPEGCELYCGSCHRADRPPSDRNSQASCGPEQVGEEARVIRDTAALPCPKDTTLQVSLSTEAEEEKCI